MMAAIALWFGLVFFGCLAWAAFELAGEHLVRQRFLAGARLSPRLPSPVTTFRLIGVICLGAALLCAWGLGR